MPDDEMFTPLSSANEKGGRRKSGQWFQLSSIPKDASAPPVAHSKYGVPTAVYEYRSQDGGLIALNRRFDKLDGGKEFLPLTYCQHESTKEQRWRIKAPLEPRPIYGLDRLASRPDAPVVLCEGEKAADAVARLLPDYIAVTTWGGSSAAGKANWERLARRDVIIWPDNDEPGHAYAKASARCLKLVSAMVRVVCLPDDVAAGWDAADAEAEGWSTERVSELVSNAIRPEGAVPVDATESSSGGSNFSKSERKGRQRGQDDNSPSQKDLLVTLTCSANLWHSPDKVAYASFPVGDHTENAAVRSKPFRYWVINRFFEEMGSAPGSQATEDALRVIEARAIYNGREYEANRRLSSDGNSIYIDIGDADWRVIEVTPTGWRIIDKTPAKFVRNKAMRALPVPEINETSGGINLLREYINTETEGEFRLLVSWLLAALSPTGPYPILIFTGQQGSAKSTATRIARDLVDPNQSPIRVMPRDDRDLMVSAINNHVLAFDNASSIAPWLSDGLCRISTGGGYATRELHSDMDEVVMDAKRPIVLNGITDLVSRPDLGERAIVVDLPAISTDNRRSEAEFRRSYERDRPLILGALLDGLASALRNLETVQLERPPRLADYALWVTAAEQGLGWSSGSIVGAYWHNREFALRIEFENDHVAQAIKALSEKGSWSGSASELKETLDGMVMEKIQKLRSWPKSAAALGGRLKRLIPILRGVGITVQQSRQHGGRLWAIECAPPI